MLRELLGRMPDLEPAGPVSWLASTFISEPITCPCGPPLDRGPVDNGRGVEVSEDHA